MSSIIAFDRKSLLPFAWLSIATSLVTMGLKVCAYLMTGSVGLLSDAIESIVNLLGGLTTLLVLKVAQTPADEIHPYGHHKAEYFSSSFEGLLILIAAFSILWTSIDRLFHPQELQELGLGLLISFLASALNLIVGLTLIKKGKAHRSIALEADGHHLMTDVWTSVAVIVGLIFVAWTHWLILDSLVAIFVALNILRTGWGLLRRSYFGFMDSAIDNDSLMKIQTVMECYKNKGVSFHALKTRQAASRSFVTVHFLVPGRWTVQYAHELAEQFEGDVIQAIGDTVVTTHLEPLEDEASMNDVHEHL